MTPERHKSIQDHYKMAKWEGASLYYTMVGDCLDEIERLRKLPSRPCSCGNPIDHDYCTKCLRQWES